MAGVTGIFRSFQSEWVKMRRRRLWWGSYGAISAVVVMTMVVDVVGAKRAGARGGSGSVAALARASGLGRGLGDSVILLGAVALSIGAAQFGGEFSHGTLRNLLVRQPSRPAFFTGKSLGVLTFLVGAVLCAAVIGMAVAFLSAHLRGIPTTAWTSSAGMASFGRSVGDLVLAACGFGFVGMALGVLLRSSVLAIGSGLAVLLPLESILASADPSLARWLPGHLLQAVAQGGTSVAGFGAALVTLAGYMVGILVLTVHIFSWRDVTA